MKRVLKTSVIALALIILMQVVVCAYSIKLKVTTDTNKYDVDKEILLTVDWETKQEAVGFTINYDASKVKFESSPDITDMFYNSSTPGKIDVNWASFDGKETTKMIFKFKTIAEGTTEFLITADKDKFSNGEMISPDSIEMANSKVSVTIAKPEAQKPNNDNTPKDQETEKDNTPTEPKAEDNQVTKNKTNTSIENDNTTSKEKMPQTGLEKTILFAIVLVSVVGIIVFKKYRGLSDI